MAGITLEVIPDNSYRKEVEDFIWASANGTLFHSPTFLSYHPEEKFSAQGGRINHLLFRKGNTVCAFMPGMLLPDDKVGYLFKSPYGGSYGSFVTGLVSFDEASTMVELLMGHLEETGARNALLVPVPPCYAENTFQDFFQYLLLRAGFKIEKTDLLIVCRLEKNSSYPHKALDKGAKHAYKQAIRKGVTAEIVDDYRIFYSLLEQNMARLDSRPTHTYEELVSIAGLYPDKVRLWLASAAGQAIAGLLFFLGNKRTANCFYVCHDERFSSYRGVNLLMTKALEWLAGEGYLWMDWGPTSFGYDPHLSLIRFKESFGGLGVPRYYLHLKKK